MINLLSTIAASTNREVKGKGLKSLAFVFIESSSIFIIAHPCEDLFADASLNSRLLFGGGYTTRSIVRCHHTGTLPDNRCHQSR